MSILNSHLVVYGSASMPLDDTTLNIGGAIDTSKRIAFDDVTPNGNMQVVSSTTDTTQTVTLTGRDASGVLITEAKTLTGVTPVPMTVNTVWERLLRAIKSATTVGDVAAESVTAVITGTATGGAAESASAMATINLASAAGVLPGMVLRATGGTGAAQIRQIISLNGTVASVNKDWAVVPDGTTTYRIGHGMVFEKTPSEVLEVRRPFYNAAADVLGGAARTYYEKMFFKNNHATLALTAAQILEQADPSGKVTFALETTLSGSGTNGAGNSRLVAPSTGIGAFDSAAKNVANSQNHTAGAGQGFWLALLLAAGDPAQKTSYTVRESGSTT